MVAARFWAFRVMEPQTPEQEKKQLETVDISAVEIFSEGSWNGDAYSHDDLQAMVDAFDKVGFEPTVKAGHADGQEDEKKAREVFGAPALGHVSRIYKAGKKLLADLVKVPKRIAELIKAGAYDRVSAEIYWDYKNGNEGQKYPRVLKAISFLGADIPALTNLKAIESLYKKFPDGPAHAFEDNGNEFRAYFASDEPNWSWFKEKIEKILSYLKIEQDPAKLYTVEKRGEEWCLVAKSTGKTLGCVIGETEVWGPKPYRSTARWYEGEIIEISVATGQKLSVTPNHPILTPHGFIPAGILNKGDQVVGAIRREREEFSDPDDYQMPAPIKDIAATFSEYVSVMTRAVSVAPEDFHGDGIGSEVCVVRTNRSIDDSLNSGSAERGAQGDFIIGGPVRSSLASNRPPIQGFLTDFQDSISLHPFDYSPSRIGREILPESPDCIRARMEGIPSPLYASGNNVSADLIASGDLGCALAGRISLGENRRIERFEAGASRNPSDSQSETNGVGGDVISAGDFVNSYASLIKRDDVSDGRPHPWHMDGFGGRSKLNSFSTQGISDGPEMDAVDLAEGLEGLPGEICFHEIINIKRFPFSGHVYNLSTVPGYYVAADIIVHNCHDSKEGAEAQERAVQANKYADSGVARIVLNDDRVHEICWTMDKRGDYAVNLPEGTTSALCDKFGENEGLRTRCMPWAEEQGMREPGAFCNALKQECFEFAQRAKRYGRNDMKLNLSREEVFKLCPPCAKSMEEKGLSALTFTAAQIAKFAEHGDMEKCMAKADMVEKFPDENARKTACSKAVGEAMMQAIQEVKGGPIMDEKKFQEEKVKLEADKQAAEQKAKEYQDKLAALEAANEEAKNKESEALKEVKKLKRERYDDQAKAWIATQKRAGKLAPVEEPKVAAIFSALYEDQRTVEFSQDGKETKKESLTDAVKSFISGRPSIFKEMSHADEEPGGESDDPQEAVDQKTKEHMAKHNMKIEQYAEAMKVVLAQSENADLKIAWLRSAKQ